MGHMLCIHHSNVDRHMQFQFMYRDFWEISRYSVRIVMSIGRCMVYLCFIQASVPYICTCDMLVRWLLDVVWYRLNKLDFTTLRIKLTAWIRIIIMFIITSTHKHAHDHHKSFNVLKILFKTSIKQPMDRNGLPVAKQPHIIYFE